MIVKVKEGIKRLWPLLLVSGGVLLPDAGSNVVLFAIGITILVSAVSHVIRKILFPYVDLGEVYSKALETPAGAAGIFVSVTMILSVIIMSTCMLLK